MGIKKETRYKATVTAVRGVNDRSRARVSVYSTRTRNLIRELELDSKTREFSKSKLKLDSKPISELELESNSNSNSNEARTLLIYNNTLEINLSCQQNKSRKFKVYKLQPNNKK